MSANIETKKQLCEEVAQKIKDSKSVVLVTYKGLSVAEDTVLRNDFRKQDVEYRVLKNTLVRKAFESLNVFSFKEDLNGPTAVAFSKDETSSAKILVEAVKKYTDKLNIKSAYVDGQYLDVKGVTALSSIPSKPELYGMLAGTLAGLIGGLAIAIKAVADGKAE